VAERALDLGVVLDLVEGDVAGAFDHDLHAAAPGAFGELAEGFEFGELGVSRWHRRGRRGGGQSPIENVTSYWRRMSQMSSQCVYMRFSALWTSIHLARSEPPREDDADEAVLDVLQMAAADAGVDGEVVHTLLGLVVERGFDGGPVEVFEFLPDDHRVDRDGADGDGGVADDGLAALVEVAARGQVHHGVGPPPLGPLELLDFFIGAGGDGAGAHVGVHLGL
jgi:hypothetical protein